MGRKGIDGIYKNENGQYVIVEVKSSEGVNIGGLNNTTGSGQQMSYDWIYRRLTDDPLISSVERDIILAGINNGGTLLVKAEIRNVAGSPSGNMGGQLTYTQINQTGRTGAASGDPLFETP